MRNFVFRYVQHEADTEDIVQEVFVRIFRHRTRYRPESRFSTWLFTIAVNLCRNRAQRKRRRPTVSLDGPASTTESDAKTPITQRASDEPSPDDAYLLSERASAVRAAVNDLPHDLRTAVLLFEYEGLSHAEIATIASTTPKAIETRLYRARHALRERLARFFRK